METRNLNDRLTLELNHDIFHHEHHMLDLFDNLTQRYAFLTIDLDRPRVTAKLDGKKTQLGAPTNIKTRAKKLDLITTVFFANPNSDLRIPVHRQRTTYQHEHQHARNLIVPPAYPREPEPLRY